MDVSLLTSMAGNAVLLVGGAVLAGKLVTARLNLILAEETAGELMVTNLNLRNTAKSQLDELIKFRANAKRVRAQALRAQML